MTRLTSWKVGGPTDPSIEIDAAVKVETADLGRTQWSSQTLAGRFKKEERKALYNALQSQRASER